MDEKIRVLSNIKTIGWTTIIIVGLATYYLFIGIVITSFMVNENPMLSQTGDFEWDNAVSEVSSIGNFMIWGLWTGVIFGSVVIYGATQLLNFKRHGLIIYHSASTLLVFALAVGIWYFISRIQFIETPSTDPWDIGLSRHMNQSRFLINVSYSVFLGVLIFIVVKANLLLTKKSYQIEFR